mmetsp:Transcript_142189/g.247841  ORF Transcript_142189/g.247841 Transcript_142189/m.247841 type:complete len:83 (-) Transcript_142189:28-276(-)
MTSVESTVTKHVVRFEESLLGGDPGTSRSDGDGVSCQIKVPIIQHLTLLYKSQFLKRNFQEVQCCSAGLITLKVQMHADAIS